MAWWQNKLLMTKLYPFDVVDFVDHGTVILYVVNAIFDVDMRAQLCEKMCERVICSLTTFGTGCCWCRLFTHDSHDLKADVPNLVVKTKQRAHIFSYAPVSAPISGRQMVWRRL